MDAYRFWAILARGAVTLVGIALVPVVFMKGMEAIKEGGFGVSLKDGAASPTPPPVSPAPTPEPTDIPWEGIGLTALIVAVLVATVLLARRYLRGRARTVALRAAQLERWDKGVKALSTVRQAIIDFETDPLAVRFARPLLADVAEPASATFYAAFGEADALHTEAVPQDDSRITEFVNAALAAESAWAAANENALRKARLGIIHGGRVLLREDKRKLSQAQTLINQALDPASTLEFAANALTKAQELLDAVGLVIPERLAVNTVQAIESIHRRELMSAQT